MGIDYRAAIYVGLPRGEITDQDKLLNLIDEGDIDVCPPFYDGNSEDHAIAGFEYEISDIYSASELKYDESDVNKLKEKFNNIFGQEAKVFISPYGY